MPSSGRSQSTARLDIVLQICEGLTRRTRRGSSTATSNPRTCSSHRRGDKEDFVTLLDFASQNIELAKEGEARLTTPGMAIGTPEYMPRAGAGEEIDRRIDVYATATMLYEMLPATCRTRPRI